VSRLRSWRAGLGLAVTALALWFAFRDVSWTALGHDLARANWWILLGFSVPAYVWTVQLRALRWRVLARDVADVPTGAAFRAISVGFLVNNVLPLRIGEFVRVWWLARDVRSSVAELLGTWVLERLFDLAVLLGIAALVIGNLAGRGLLGGIAFALLAVTLAFRLWPAPLLRLVYRAARLVLPPARAEHVTGLAGSVARGLASLRSGRDFARALFHSALLWGVASAIPFWAALAALGIDVGGPVASLRTALQILVNVAIAVALPSAPGFFGVYHAACRYTLTPLGVSTERALALGTLAHAVFWLVTSGIGLFCLRGRRSQLGEAVSSAATGDAPV